MRRNCNYQLHLVDNGASPTSLNSAIGGLKFFFNITLDRVELVAKMQPVHLPRKVPVILSPEEAKRLIAAAGDAGLRSTPQARTSLRLGHAITRGIGHTGGVEVRAAQAAAACGGARLG